MEWYWIVLISYLTLGLALGITVKLYTKNKDGDKESIMFYVVVWGLWAATYPYFIVWAILRNWKERRDEKAL